MTAKKDGPELKLQPDFNPYPMKTSSNIIVIRFYFNATTLKYGRLCKCICGWINDGGKSFISGLSNFNVLVTLPATN